MGANSAEGGFSIILFKLLALPKITTDWSKLKEFVEYWESLPLWNSENRLSIEKKKNHRKIRLSNNPYGLALNLKHQGQGKQNNLLSELKKINTKTLILYGEKDNKYKISKNTYNKIDRLMLHAYKISFSIDNIKYSFLADIPKDFISSLKKKYLKIPS